MIRAFGLTYVITEPSESLYQSLVEDLHQGFTAERKCLTLLLKQAS